MNTKKNVPETCRGEKSSRDIFSGLGEASRVLDECDGGVVEGRRCTRDGERKFLKRKNQLRVFGSRNWGFQIEEEMYFNRF